MPIFKTAITHTVYGEFDSIEEAREYFASAEPTDISSECDSGSLFGEVELGEIAQVPKGEVPEFFNSFDGVGEDDQESPEGPRIVATFVPQAWVNDCAVDVDPEGETEWDVTDTLTADLSREELAKLKDNRDEADTLREEPNAPRWVRRWAGPFYVRVASSIADYLEATADAE